MDRIVWRSPASREPSLELKTTPFPTGRSLDKDRQEGEGNMSESRPKINPRPGYGSARAIAAARTTSSGSFHAGAPIPSLPTAMRRQSTYRYQTFPTPPPKTPLEQPAGSDASESGSDDDHEETPLPVRQLLLLAFLSLAEQTALNSISPYLPQLVESMPGIPVKDIGVYVGILASSFPLAQLSTNFLWGYASDLVGRKPVLLLGTFSLMCCFVAFGFCTQYWHVILVHVAMGMLNGNAACVPTVLGEVTDRSNQSKAFTYLPIIYSLGGISGPALGGVLVGTLGGSKYPYLGPNIVSAVILGVSVVVVAIWFEETLDESDGQVGLPSWAVKTWAWVSGSSKDSSRRNSWSARWPQGSSGNQPLLSSASSTSSRDTDDEPRDESQEPSKDSSTESPIWREILNRTTIILLITYLVFQLSNISFNTLYPIFAAASPPTGRKLDPGKIGVSLSLAGVATIVFQAFLYQPLKTRIGNLGTYRLALLGIAISMVLMPWVGYVDQAPPFRFGTGKAWLYTELAVVLILKNVCAVGGLSSVMLLITNSAPSHASLGTLNGVAQTLSALGRSIGPFVSGGLFTLSTNIRPKGEALAWCLFGGLALAGWVLALFIRDDSLESDDWIGSHEHDNDEEQQD
ncbi:Major facilitator superfamily multidrug transporter mfsB [Paramyrothecium foliicola]|nr:Major facilitator superfamily multidrug transporter mfsB [Paramyrothecium foliicola]